MDSNLIIYDMKVFFDKYTRFMTKNIYISTKMYDNFIMPYNYLYKTLVEEKFLYSTQKDYNKIMDIFINKKNLIKLHNKKYLQNNLLKYQVFFNNSTFGKNLTNNQKMIVLSEEENTYIVDSKESLSLVISKINYLIEYKNYIEDDILILTENRKESFKLIELIKEYYPNIIICDTETYSKRLLTREKLLNHTTQYNILLNYIINNLFSNKKKFNSFKSAFSKYIYLNKDYQEYETFKDYHNYMYKRKFLSTKLSLKKFNQKEIKSRKKYLRTIKNETLKQKELIDIANFLYLNGIEYTNYDNTFEITSNTKKNYIKYLDRPQELSLEETSSSDIIYLYSKYINNSTYLEMLTYELIKRRYPLELIEDERVYQQLRNTSIDNYFSEFLTKYLIPLINYYEEYQTLDNIQISTIASKEFLNIYKEYTNYINNNNLLSKKELYYRVETNINNSSIKYLFLLGDISMNTNKKTFTIVNNYPKNEFLKESIKLLYDYKKNIYQNQTIPIPHTYLSKEELNYLTNKFLKDNLSIINKNLENKTKRIEVYEYNDNNRLHIYKNISDTCFKILENNKKNTLIAVTKLKDINILINNNNFIKVDSNTLLTKNNQKIRVEEILKINKRINTIILPYLIIDSYHDDLFINEYNLKVLLYATLNSCLNKIIILCPSSKKNNLDKILSPLTYNYIKSV